MTQLIVLGHNYIVSFDLINAIKNYLKIVTKMVTLASKWWNYGYDWLQSFFFFFRHSAEILSQDDIAVFSSPNTSLDSQRNQVNYFLTVTITI